MTATREPLSDRFRGSLLGTFVGDAFGAPLEGFSASRIRREYGEVRSLLPGRRGAGRYTDETLTMIAVAEWLTGEKEPDEAGLAARLAAAYDVTRGFGRGATDLVRRLAAGESWETAAEHVFPRGSFGNGAACRMAPVALLLHHDRDALDRLAERSAVVTHPHPLGVAGAVLQARQIALALTLDPAGFDPIEVAVALRSSTASLEFRQKLRAVEECLERNASEGVVRDRLGCNATALGSVPTALFCVLSRPRSFEEAVVYAVSLGGATDSIGAMTGAIAGALHGARAIPGRWRRALEEGPGGASYVESLADRLLLRHREMRSPRRPR